MLPASCFLYDIPHPDANLFNKVKSEEILMVLLQAILWISYFSPYCDLQFNGLVTGSRRWLGYPGYHNDPTCGSRDNPHSSSVRLKMPEASNVQSRFLGNRKASTWWEALCSNTQIGSASPKLQRPCFNLAAEILLQPLWGYLNSHTSRWHGHGFCGNLGKNDPNPYCISHLADDYDLSFGLS